MLQPAFYDHSSVDEFGNGPMVPGIWHEDASLLSWKFAY